MAAKRFVVVVNPRGGTRRGMAVLESVKPVFHAAGAELEVHVTTHKGHAQELAKTINLEEYDGFCVVGGDGTLHEAVGGLMQQNDPKSIPLGVIPAGTGNSVLQSLECFDPLEAVRRIIAGNAHPLDVIRVTMGNEVAYCVNIVGWGNVVDINFSAERLRALGPSRYAVAAMLHVLRAKTHRATLVLDDKIVEDEFALIIACNTKFTGKGMLIAPRAEMNDGKIDVIVVRRSPRLQLCKLLKKVSNGSHVSLSCVEYYHVKSFSIKSDNRESLNLDGEVKGSTPVSADIMCGALRLFV
jgi:YegS/Rv2252/BmrU family lipid kinase